MRHTKGPWEVRRSSNPRNGTAWRDIVSMGEEFRPAYVGEALENDATLIAAAPDLLEALANLLRASSKDFTHPQFILALDNARAAIEKATGGSNDHKA